MAEVIVPYPQYKIDSGDGYFANYSAFLDFSESSSVMLRTGSKPFYFNFSVATLKLCEVTMAVDVQFSATGTFLTSSNLNRSSSNTPTHAIYEEPVISDAGQSIIPSRYYDGESWQTGDGQFVPRLTRGDVFADWFIAEINTDYLITITDRASGAQWFNVWVYGFEV